MYVISDIDGTLAIRTHRGPFEWQRLHEDVPNPAVIEVLHSLHLRGHTLLLFSGRSEQTRAATEQWLERFLHVPHRLFMRRNNDNRRDEIVKAEFLLDSGVSADEILVVLDDRDRVVEMWRTRFGLRCFQVAPGSF